MFTCKEYRKVKTLEEAWELNQKRSNQLIGGMLWVKMGQRSVQTVIDLSDLGLDQIEETEEEFSIGCMATLRQLELHEGLNVYTQGAVRESVRHIVGVQFRNLATVGGSIFGRFGFSDVLTMFLAMDTYVELYKGGVVPLDRFVEMKRDRDILVRVIVKKENGRFAYQSMRNTKTDFPVLAVAVSAAGDRLRISVGARPARAMLLTVSSEKICDAAAEVCRAAGQILSGEGTEDDAALIGAYVSQSVPTGSNLRGSAQYRSHLVQVLVKRACLETGGKAAEQR